MSDVVLRVENLYKRYRLGTVDRQTFKEDMVSWWAKVRGKPDPYEQYITSNELANIKDSEAMRNLQARYVWALQDINFEVKQGEIVGIIGKNGAGKSTLLKILSKTTTPTKGKVKVKGRIASLLEVGTGFHGELTGRENIYLNGAILGMTRHEITRHLDEIIDFAGVEAYIDTPVKRYSSGMYVRLAFAVGAHLLSDILIVDEVLAVGDAEFQKKCIGKMKDVSSGEGKTVLFVSHNMQILARLCSIGIILEQGRLIANGEIVPLVEQYLKNKSGHQIISKQSTNSINIEKISFLNKENLYTDTLVTFENIKVEIKGCAKYEHKNVSVAICFNDLQGNRVTSLWSSYFAKTFNLPSGNFRLIFSIPNIKLMPGEYEVISYVEANGIEIQRIDNFRRVNVIYSNQFGFTTEPNPSQGFYIENFEVQLI